MNDDLPLKASVKAGEVKAGEAISGLQKPAKQMSGLSSTDFLRAADPDIQGVPKKCPIANFSFNLFQRSNYIFTCVPDSEFQARSI